MLGLLPMTHPPSAPWALSGVQLRALSQGSLVKVLPAWEERVCGWGGGRHGAIPEVRRWG